MSPDSRDAILKGSQAAERVFQKYDLKKKLSSGKDPVDVFQLIESEAIVLCFRKLDKLFGAYMPLEKGKEGVLINSEHPLYTQRYTAAHELGHHVMGHLPSIDTNLLERAPVFDDNTNPGGNPLQEKEADSFASFLLMPRWLIIGHLKDLGWSYAHLRSPANIYQLSLRLGVSFSAACWGLFTHQMLDYNTASKYSKITPKEIKRSLISEEILNTNPWGNVWVINQTSSEVRLLGGAEDFFVFEIEEHASGGYEWNFEQLEQAGFKVLEEINTDPSKEMLGGPIVRKVTVTNTAPISQILALHEKRSWNNEMLNEIKLHFELNGRGKGFYPKIVLPQVA
jgi:Zn-dependent peptidase ImmA (M78 family)